ncbi:unnamed protein product, partial [Rotaria magnacalcarata]
MHEILLSTLLLEQQLHLTATNEHKRKAPRPPPSTVDFYFSDITVNTTPIVDGDSAKQNEIAIENLEQDSNKGIEVLESAEYEWKSATKNGQQQT